MLRTSLSALSNTLSRPSVLRSFSSAGVCFPIPEKTQSWIDGKYHGQSGPEMPNFAPATGSQISTVEVASQATIDAAVASSQAAQPAWAALSGAERGRILTRAAVLIREYNAELSVLESVDAGIPVSETEFVQVLGGADSFEYFGGLASNACVTGQMMDTPHAGGDADSFCYTRREPLGVCAGIGAWNYPVLVMSWKVAPALACGNTFIYKPSECTPLTALKIAEILKEAGLPDGVFNVVVGDRTTGPMLSSHDEVKKLSFTGSTETGIRIVKDAADTLKKVTMELGGKSPLLVFEDADIDNAVAAAMMSNWYTQGEICSNATRVFVHKSIKGEFTKKLVARTKQLVIGDPLDPSTHVGAMIMPPDNKSGHLDRVVGFIERAKQDPDNKLILGGNTHTIEAGKVDGRGGVGNEGCYVEPTIFECSNDNSELVKEEVFGPVMSLLEFEDEDDAVKRANDTKWGLGAGVMTNNLARAHRIAKKFQSGNVWINNYNLTPSEMPFGGYGMSGYGRECGTYAIDSWTQIKNVYVEMGDVDSSCYPK